MNTCSTAGCGKPIDSRGLCKTCWARHRRRGTLPPKIREGGPFQGKNNIPAVIRFWAQVNKTAANGCWEWTGCKDGDGYGTIMVNTKRMRAHRYAYEELRGTIPDGMMLCHRCDNPPCVNPDHMFVGTAEDNARDRDAKGRTGRCYGERNGFCKLSDADVLSILGMLKEGKLQKDVAEEFHVNSATVYRIAHGRTRARSR